MDSQSLAGTQWKVVAINGKPTPTTGGFEVRFDSRTMIARMGCNSGSSDYHIVGDTIRTSVFARTEMACDYAGDEPQTMPLMAWEELGFAVLNQPLNVRWTSANALILSSKAGSIALQRTP